jgi:hypothetical protein
MLTVLVGLYNALFDAVNFIVESVYEFGKDVVYGIASFFLDLLGQFLDWLFTEKLDWLPILEEPEWLLQWAEIANNFVPIDQFVTYLSAYLAFEFGLWLYSWTFGLFWSP